MYRNIKHPGVVVRQGPSIIFIDGPVADDFADAFAELTDDLPPRLGRLATFKIGESR